MANGNPRVSDWMIEIERGLEFRRKYGIEDSWAMLEALYSNVHESQANSAPNLISSTGDSLLSTLCTPYPYISVAPRLPGGVPAAPVLENVDNTLIDDMRTPEEMETGFLCAYLFGVGFVKNGYDSEFGWDPKLDIGLGLRKEFGLSMSQFDVLTGEKIEFGAREPGMPWNQAVLPHDMVFPWGTRNVRTARWAVHRVIRRVEECKADKKYSNTAGLEPNMSMEDFMKSYLSPFKPYRMGRVLTLNRTGSITDNKKPEFVELWEIHDRATQTIKVIATGHDEFLRDETDMLQLDGQLPFTEIKFVQNTRSIWTTPDAYYMLPHQLELTDITIQNAKARRTRILKGIVNNTMFEEEELQRLTSARVSALIKCNGDPREAIAWTNPPPDFSMAGEAQAVKAAAQETVGLGDNQRGQYSGGRRTAYEAAQVADAVNKRMSRREVIVDRVYTELFKKINESIFRFWKTPKLSQILDQTGQAIWMQFTGAGLKSEYNLEVSFENEGSMGRAAQRQMAMSLFAQLQQDPTVDQMKLRQWFSRSMNDVGISGVFKQGVLDGTVDANLLVQMQQQAQGGKGGASGSNAQPSQGSQVPQMQGANGPSVQPSGM